MAPQLTLYRANKSCALAPQSAMHYLGIPFSTVLMLFAENGKLEGADGNLSYEEYCETVNPAGMVPCLVVDGTRITEVTATLTYIASLAPEKNLLGYQGLERAQTYEWLTWLTTSVHGQGFGSLWRPGRFSDNKSHHEGIKAKGRIFLASCYERIEEKLRGRVHPIGEDFTVVDFYLNVFWRWGVEIGFEMKKFENFARVIQNLENLESVKLAVAENGGTLCFAS